jgi:hypothetical protein
MKEMIRDPEKRARNSLCSLCGQHYSGYGNNAFPIEYGRCCDICFYLMVIPARHRVYFNRMHGHA